MLNIDKVKDVYLACGATSLRKSIDGLALIVETQIKKNSYQNALFVFCNKAMNRLKVLYFDECFLLYYYKLDSGKLKWPQNKDEVIKINKKKLKCLLKGYEIGGVCMKNNNNVNSLKKELELKNKEIESKKNRLDFLEKQILK